MSRVEVDPEICIGMGMCEGISAAFRVGDSGTVDIGDTADVDPVVLRRAVAACPTGALRMADDV
ncbi:ferredoxin [Mycobacterium sp. SM3041]|uniref:ferredoxin n=1 Tax=Mycobacterium sp. SM3041 TaxID=3114291 RepID=UPI003204DED4